MKNEVDIKNSTIYEVLKYFFSAGSFGRMLPLYLACLIKYSNNIICFGKL
jgi:hypothetical protein